MTKRRIALIQLWRSIQLLEDFNDSVCSLTLAGAAEEILGRIAKRRGQEPTVKSWVEYLGTIYDFYNKPRPQKRELIRRHNFVRNELKHNDSGINTYIEADFRMEAEDMIIRAIKNYFLAFNCLPSNRRIRDWFDNITL